MIHKAGVHMTPRKMAMNQSSEIANVWHSRRINLRHICFHTTCIDPERVDGIILEAG